MKTSHQSSLPSSSHTSSINTCRMISRLRRPQAAKRRIRATPRREGRTLTATRSNTGCSPSPQPSSPPSCRTICSSRYDSLVPSLSTFTSPSPSSDWKRSRMPSPSRPSLLFPFPVDKVLFHRPSSYHIVPPALLNSRTSVWAFGKTDYIDPLKWSRRFNDATRFEIIDETTREDLEKLAESYSQPRTRDRKDFEDEEEEGEEAASPMRGDRSGRRERRSRNTSLNGRRVRSTSAATVQPSQTLEKTRRAQIDGRQMRSSSIEKVTLTVARRVVPSLAAPSSFYHQTRI